MKSNKRSPFLWLPACAALFGSTFLLAGCSHNSGGAAVVPQTRAQDTAARIQAIKNNPQLSDQEKQQQIQRLQAESGS